MEVKGTVVRGEGLAAKTYGVPTANLQLAEGLKPDEGVFAGWAFFENEKRPCVISSGAGDPKKFEVHVYDFKGDLYGKEMVALAFAKVSDLVPWTSEEQMKKKVLDDVARARTYFIREG